MADFITSVTSALGAVTSSMSVFTQPPIIYFVALAGVAATVGVIKRLIPMKKH